LAKKGKKTSNRFAQKHMQFFLPPHNHLLFHTAEHVPYTPTAMSPKQKQPRKANKYELFVDTTFVFGRQLMH